MASPLTWEQSIYLISCSLQRRLIRGGRELNNWRHAQPPSWMSKRAESWNEQKRRPRERGAGWETKEWFSFSFPLPTPSPPYFTHPPNSLRFSKPRGNQQIFTAKTPVLQARLHEHSGTASPMIRQRSPTLNAFSHSRVSHWLFILQLTSLVGKIIIPWYSQSLRDQCLRFRLLHQGRASERLE